MTSTFPKNLQYYKFCFYGFLKNLRFFEPFLLLFFLERGMSFFEIGILKTIQEVTRQVFEVPSGFLSDIFGRRRTMVMGFALYIISFLLFYFSSSFGPFIIAAAFFGLGDAFRTGTHKAMIFDYLRRNELSQFKVHYYGHTRSWSQFGSSISAILAAIIVFYSGQYAAIFLLSAVPYFADLLLLASYPAYLDGETKAEKTISIKDKFRQHINQLWSSFKKKNILVAVSNLSSFSGYFRSIKDYLQPVIESFAIALPVLVGLGTREKSAILIGLIYFVIYLLTAFISRNTGKIIDRTGNLAKTANISLYIGFALGIIAGIFFSIKIAALTILLFLILHMMENFRRPAGVAYISDQFSDKVQATALSVESQFKTLFTALSAPLVGFIADQLSIGAALIGISGVFLVLAFFIRMK